MNLILDMDGTLIDGFYDDNNNHVVKPRPHLKDFFEFIFAYFENISIWTHGDESWYKIVYDECLKYMLPINKNFHFVKTREYGNESYPYKKLSKIYKEYDDYNEFNTFIIDDFSKTYELNIENSIPIKNYTYTFNEHTDTDDEFLRIIKLFKKKLFCKCNK